MANRLMQERKKCFKSPNIFRDKQEYSSLYTISSRSAVSVQSAEMSTPKAQQQQDIPQQNRIYRGQHHKGDSAEMKNYKYPKLPNDVSQELQEKVYSNSYKKNYGIIKSKFDGLMLDNGAHANSYYPVNTNNNGRNPQSNPQNQHYTINRLEESYWAKWKPNRCDSVENWRSYDDQTKCVPCNRRPRCATTRTMAQDCMKMLAQVTNSNKRPKNKCYADKPLEIIREPDCMKMPTQPRISNKRPNNKCCEEKPLEIIREPAEIRESNSSEVGVVRKDQRKTKSKCSCCSCPTRTGSTSDDEKTSDVTTTNYTTTNKQTKTTPTDTMETSQEEYEHLYNEMYREYESDLMNTISEYEMQREEEEMREVEQQLEREDRKRQERESQKQVDRERARMSYEYAYAKSTPHAAMQETYYSNVYEQYDDSKYEANEEINSLPNNQISNARNEGRSRITTPLELSRIHTPEQSRTNIKGSRPPSRDAQSVINSPKKQSKASLHEQEPQVDARDRGSPRGSQQGNPLNQETPQTDNIKVREGSTRGNPLESSRGQEQQPSIRESESPRGSLRGSSRRNSLDQDTPQTDNIKVREGPTRGNSLERSRGQEQQPSIKETESPRGSLRGGSRRNSFDQDTPQTDNIKVREGPTRGNSLERSRGQEQQPSIKESESPGGSLRGSSRRGSPTGSTRERGGANPLKEQQKSNDLIETPDTKHEGIGEKVLTFDKELTPHLSSSTEYSEPEIAILKHTDSFIINSRRQKEDRPRKPQPKFLKLSKTPFTAPPVKGHTYPLKPVLKKMKTPAPAAVGTTRPLSPPTPKARTPSKPFQPAYLTRH